MIRSFALDGRLFSLVPDAVQKDKSLNIFSADSMTLLVGPNGSGKTHALSQLASLFDVEPIPDLVTNSPGGKFSDKLLGDIEGLDETYAVYYTAIPFGVDMPSRSNRFVCIVPEHKRHRKPPDLGVALPVLSEFGLKVTTTLRLHRGYMEIVELLLRTVEQFRSPVADFWLEPIRERLADLNSRERAATQERLTSGASFSDYWDSEGARFLREAKNIILKDFSSLLRDHIGEDFRLRLRALALARSENRKTTDAFLQLLKDFGFSLNRSPNRKQPAASKAFKAALESFKSVAQIVKDPTLELLEYEVNTAQWKALAAMDLSGVASLSATNLSSGGAALLEQFSALKRAIDALPTTAKNLLLLVDEGDVYLHLAWQQKYVDFFDSMVKALWRQRFNCIQVVMTTHSPVLMSDFPRDCIHRMSYADGLQTQVFDEDQAIVSFAAPLESVIHHTGNAGTLGSFSARVIRKIAKDIEHRKDVAEYRLNMIDDGVIVRQLRRLKSDLASQPSTRDD